MSPGYAIRKSWLESLSPTQLQLIRDDHYNVHRYAHFSGEKYLFLPQAYGQWTRTPASLSCYLDDDINAIDIATIEEYRNLELGGDAFLMRVRRLIERLLVRA